MKKLLIIAMVLVCAVAMSQSIQEGTGFDPGALRKDTLHNDLDGVNAGDYLHLTAAELAAIQAIDDTYALKNGDLTEDFAAKHLDVDTATITTQLQIGASADLNIVGDGAGGVTFVTDTATFSNNLHVEQQLSVGQVVDIQIIGDGAGNALFEYTGTATFANNYDVLGTFSVNGVDVLGDISAALAAILGE